MNIQTYMLLFFSSLAFFSQKIVKISQVYFYVKNSYEENILEM